ncbi:MAG TPA: hypothetical protein ENO22_01970 [candidate division Zixibacteria bacterium]|nr:hypothetical protein [candidate division Zixibacteria bacterium]
MKKAKVAKSYKSAYPDPLILRSGQKLRTEEKESEWPGWTWCVDDDGRAGWVPSSYLQITENTARAITDYNANELTVDIGDELQLLEEESGWYWCENSNGERGWVPAECISDID